MVVHRASMTWSVHPRGRQWILHTGGYRQASGAGVPVSAGETVTFAGGTGLYVRRRDIDDLRLAGENDLLCRPFLEGTLSRLDDHLDKVQ
jgi:hypothetical protein